MAPMTMTVYSYGSDIDRMLGAVRKKAFQHPHPIHIDLFPGPSPDDEHGTFVVATWAFGDQLYAAWDRAGPDMKERLQALFEWTGKAQLRGLVVRSGMGQCLGVAVAFGVARPSAETGRLTSGLGISIQARSSHGGMH